MHNKQFAKCERGQCYIQWNPDDSNTDDSFTMANSNSFLSPFEILPIAQEIKYSGNFSYVLMTLYVVCTHLNRGDSNEYTQNTIIVWKIENISLNYCHLLPDLAP